MEFPSSKVTGCHPKTLYMYFEINPCQTRLSFISMFSIPAE